MLSAYDDPDPTTYPFDVERSAPADPVSPAGGRLLVLAVVTLIGAVAAAFDWFTSH